MMDFNASKSLSGQLTALIDAGMQQSRAAQPRRTYLGASRLGALSEPAAFRSAWMSRSSSSIQAPRLRPLGNSMAP